jgi:hypothetical protein
MQPNQWDERPSFQTAPLCAKVEGAFNHLNWQERSS